MVVFVNVSVRVCVSVYMAFCMRPRHNEEHYDPVVTIDGTELTSVKSFCYPGSVMSFNGSLDDEITKRISKASVAFGR